MSILLFLSFITLIFIGFPVAWTMGGLAVLFTLVSMLSDTYLDTFFGVDLKFSSMVVYRLYGVMANWVLVALPMFIFMGIMMDKSGIAEDLMTDLSKLFGRMRGGLAIAIVFIGVLLAASTGIIGASVVLLTILGVPLMLKNNYSPDLSMWSCLCNRYIGNFDTTKHYACNHGRPSKDFCWRFVYGSSISRTCYWVCCIQFLLLLMLI